MGKLKNKHFQIYQRDLLRDLMSSRTGSYGEMVQSLFKPLHVYDAESLEKAMQVFFSFLETL